MRFFVGFGILQSGNWTKESNDMSSKKDFRSLEFAFARKE